MGLDDDGQLPGKKGVLPLRSELLLLISQVSPFTSGQIISSL